jgi:NitT/TauT family transport system ATP-binding protein
MTRERLQEEPLTIWRATGLSVVFVTHSLEAAIYLADRVVVISPGPGQIVAEERIPLEPPRDMPSPEFNDIRRHLASLLHANHARVAA